jgi:hypothetical protein
MRLHDYVGLPPAKKFHRVKIARTTPTAAPFLGLPFSF